jgi:MjaI restriction endonuclease.
MKLLLIIGYAILLCILITNAKRKVTAMLYKISNQELSEIYNIEEVDYEKYVPQIINLANQNAQATRPRNVGQLSDLFPEFIGSHKGASVEDWEKWYKEAYPTAMEDAAKKIYSQVSNLKKAMESIDMDTVLIWVHDLIINKTFTGLYFQEAIISKIANLRGEAWRLANPDEEARGIDGYIGKTPVSVKPQTYKTMDRLSEQIGVGMIYYEKKKDGIVIEFND